MKKVVVLCLAILVCFMMAACGSSGSKSVDLNGAVLKGYENAAFEVLIKRACKSMEEDYKRDGENIEVNCQITKGWSSEEFAEDDLLYKQKAVTCSVIISGLVDGQLMRVTRDFYMVLDESDNTLEIVGGRFYSTDGEQEHESIKSKASAMEILDWLLD